jgi:hypothetical protein
MSILSELKSDPSIADETDSVGGGSRVLETNVYKFKIQHAYVTKSSGGAAGMVVSMKTDAGQELRQTFWMTSGTAKGATPYYTDKKSGEKKYLPGYLLANSLCLLTVGQEISNLDTEKKVIPLYNAEAKKEVPTEVDMMMDLVGKDVLAAVFKQTVDKTKKNEDGIYVPTGETRDENEIDKFFRERDGMTKAEILAQAEKATFVETWKEKWAGKTRDRTKGATGAKGAAGLPTTNTKKPTSSLFATN